jgi:DNA primase
MRNGTPLWPGTGIAELAAYYRRVPKRVRRYFEGRPLLFARAPGSAGSEIMLEYHGGRRDDLLDMERWATRRVVEVQAMNAIASHIHRPDWMVFGLASGGQSAFALRSVLEELGLAFLGKTRGVSGIDVLVPLKPSYEAAVVYDLARMIGGLAVDRLPGVGPIETERNHSRRMIVAPFSTRAGSYPYISLPAPWDVLEAATEPPVYDLGSPKRSLERGAALLERAIDNPHELEPVFVAIEELESLATNT